MDATIPCSYDALVLRQRRIHSLINTAAVKVHSFQFRYVTATVSNVNCGLGPDFQRDNSCTCRVEMAYVETRLDLL